MGASEKGDTLAKGLLDEAVRVRVPIVSLHRLRHGELMSCGDASTALSKRGFCWLAMDDAALQAVAVPAESTCRQFLSGPGNRSGQDGGITGHITSKHKDAIRVLTGAERDGSIGSVPDDVSDVLHNLAIELDAAQTDILSSLAHVFGGDSAEAVSKAADVALLSGTERRYALLDSVLYRAKQAPTEVVAPHIDPGLLVLALPSDPGLELRDESGFWLSPPEGCGVLWCGCAAQQCVPATHRVIVSSTPRFALWHELYTRGQATPPMLD